MRPDMVEPISDEELARLKKSIVDRWENKPHYIDDEPLFGNITDSPGCMMRAHEVLALVKRIEQLQTVLDSRPAINAALPESYVRWSQSIYEMEALHVYGHDA